MNEYILSYDVIKQQGAGIVGDMYWSQGNGMNHLLNFSCFNKRTINRN